MRKPFPGWETGNLFGVALARVTKEHIIKRKEERHVTFVCFACPHLLSEAIIMGVHIT